MRKLIPLAVVAMMTAMALTSCSKDDDDIAVVPRPEEQVVLNCVKPDYLRTVRLSIIAGGFTLMNTDVTFLRITSRHK